VALSPTVATSVAVQEPVRPVRVTVFAGLKLRIMAYRLRGGARLLIGFVFGVIAGLALAVTGFSVFLLSGALSRDAGFTVAGLVGAGLTIGWLLMPLLFFGVDDTLDPARFALFPRSRAGCGPARAVRWWGRSARFSRCSSA
jgi:ABC-2 type transport system permease protein